MFSKAIIQNCYSSLNHAGLDAEMSDTGEVILSGVTPFPMVVRVEVGTGLCGEGWSTDNILPAGTNIDSFAHDCAVNHAMSYGHMEDEEQDEESGFDESNLESMVYWYHPAISGSLINGGDPIRRIVAAIEDEGLEHNSLNELFYIPNTETRHRLLDDI